MPGATTAAVSSVRGSELVTTRSKSHVLERAVRGGGLLEAPLGQAHELRIALADVRDLGMPHQVEPPAHAA